MAAAVGAKGIRKARVEQVESRDREALHSRISDAFLEEEVGMCTWPSGTVWSRSCVQIGTAG